MCAINLRVRALHDNQNTRNEDQKIREILLSRNQRIDIHNKQQATDHSLIDVPQEYNAPTIHALRNADKPVLYTIYLREVYAAKIHSSATVWSSPKKRGKRNGTRPEIWFFWTYETVQDIVKL